MILLMLTIIKLILMIIKHKKYNIKVIILVHQFIM
jgi:hypothetical protein